MFWDVCPESVHTNDITGQFNPGASMYVNKTGFTGLTDSDWSVRLCTAAL